MIIWKQLIRVPLGLRYGKKNTNNFDCHWLQIVSGNFYWSKLTFDRFQISFFQFIAVQSQRLIWFILWFNIKDRFLKSDRLSLLFFLDMYKMDKKKFFKKQKKKPCNLCLKQIVNFIHLFYFKFSSTLLKCISCHKTWDKYMTMVYNT